MAQTTQFSSIQPPSPPTGRRSGGQLRASSLQMPIRDQDTAQRVKATQDLTTQAAVQGAVQAPPTGVSTAQVAQKVAPQIQLQAGQQQATLHQAAQEVGRQERGLARQQEALDIESRLARAAMANQRQELANREKLGLLSESIKNDILDSELSFRRDETGRAFLNERQLLDYKVQSARDKEELQNWVQYSQQQHSKKLQVLEAANRVVQQKLQQDYETARAAGNRDLQRQILQKKKEYEEKVRAAQAKKARNAAIGAGIAGVVVAGAAVAATVATGGAAAPIALPVAAAAMGPAMTIGGSVGAAQD